MKRYPYLSALVQTVVALIFVGAVFGYCLPDILHEAVGIPPGAGFVATLAVNLLIGRSVGKAFTRRLDQLRNAR